MKYENLNKWTGMCRSQLEDNEILAIIGYGRIWLKVKVSDVFAFEMFLLMQLFN